MVPNLRILVLFFCAIADLALVAAPGIGQLPPHLRFEEGKINLVVDYSAVELDRVVTVYIVNATDAPKRMFIVPLVFRETRGDDGQWRRCDPVIPPECGTGLLDSLEIPPSCFYATNGLLNSEKGERRPVRFRKHTPDGAPGEISNEGIGLVDPELVEACRFDLFGVSRGPFEDVARVALNQVSLPRRPDFLRDLALHRIEQWKGWPNRIEVLKTAIAKAKAANDQGMYRFVLDLLRTPVPPEWSREDYWKFATQEFQSGAPLASVAFESMIYAPFFHERKRPFLDRIIGTPQHPSIARAIETYSDIAGESAARKVAQRILRSSKCPDSAKNAAKAIVNR